MFIAYKRKHPKLFWLTVIVAILLPCISIGLTVLIKNPDSRVVISDISSPIYNLVATLSLIFAAKQSKNISKRLALGWGILALAQFSFTLGDVLWAFLELYFKSSPFPSIADGFYLIYYPLFFVGITLLPSKRLNSTEWLKRALDISIVMITAILGFWIFLISPMAGIDSSTTTLEKILTAAYPVGDLIVIFALLVILYYRSERSNPVSLWILTIGSIVMIFSDSIFSYQSLTSIYQSGGWLDLSWIFSYILITAAGIFQGIASQNYLEDGSQPARYSLVRERVSRFLSYMPYIWVVFAYYLLNSYYNLNSAINAKLLFLCVGCIIGLVISRQIISLNENNRLVLNLRQAVEQGRRQAFELDKINKNLQQEITKRELVEEQLSHDALHDGLTGLANRVLLTDRLNHVVEIAKRTPELHFSVLFLDIDNFKSINDGLGHISGDQTLIEIAQRLKSCVRSNDTVARFGGDEFAIILDHTMDENTAISVSNRILFELKQPFIQKDIEVVISCSIGIVPGISEYNNSEEILRDVDIALYKAKENGKARYELFSIDMRTSAITRLEIEADLHRAVVNNELFLVYQPIYAFEQNIIVGVEALVRWRHPHRGLVMPSEFIHIAEETGLINQIGDWVMQEACIQLKKWHLDYPEMEYLTVNVNISGKQINQIDFVDKVKDILDKTDLNPKRLTLEITENAFVECQILTNDFLSEIRKIGVTFAVDDFGTGYSSLGYLQNFSVDTVKIDKSFVDQILIGKKGYEIIKTIIFMAERMGMNTIAEGIESEEQLQKLKDLCCKYGQGFYLSRPVDVKQIETIFKKQLILI